MKQLTGGFAWLRSISHTGSGRPLGMRMFRRHPEKEAMTRLQGTPTGRPADRSRPDETPPPKRPRTGEASSSRTESGLPARSQQAAAGSPPPRAALPAPRAASPAAGSPAGDMLRELAAQPGDVVFGHPESLPLAPHQRSAEAQQRRHLALLSFEASIDQELNEMIEAFMAAQPDIPSPGHDGPAILEEQAGEQVDENVDEMIAGWLTDPPPEQAVLPGHPQRVHDLGQLQVQAPQQGPGAIHLDEQVDQEVADMIAELLAQDGDVAFQEPAAQRRKIDIPQADRALIATFAEMGLAGGSKKATVNYLSWALKRFSEWLGQQGRPSLDARRAGPEFDADVALYIEQGGPVRIDKALAHLQTAMSLQRIGAIELPQARRLAVGSDDVRLVDWFAQSARAGDSNRANVENAAWSMRLFSTWREGHQLPPLARSLGSETLATELDDFVAETGSKNARTALRMLAEATNNEHVLQAFIDHQLAEGTNAADEVLGSAHVLRQFGEWLEQQGLGVIANRLTGPTAETDVAAYLAQGGDAQVIAAIHELREARSAPGFGAVSMPRRPEYAPASVEDEALLGTFSETAKLTGMNPTSVDNYVSAVRRFAASLPGGDQGSLKARLHDPTLDAELENFIKQGGSRQAKTGLAHMRSMMPPATTQQTGRDPAAGPAPRREPPRRGRPPVAPRPIPGPPSRIGRPPGPGLEAAMAAALAPTLRTTRVPAADATLIDSFLQRKLASGLTKRNAQDQAGALRSFSKWLALNGGPLLSERLHDDAMNQFMESYLAEGWHLAEPALRQLRAEFPALPAAPTAVPVAPAAARPAPAVVIAPPVRPLLRPSGLPPGPPARSLLNANPVDIEAAISAMRRRSLPRETVERDVGLPPGALATVVDPQGRWLDEFAQLRAVRGLSLQQMQDFAQLVEHLRNQLGGS